MGWEGSDGGWGAGGIPDRFIELNWPEHEGRHSPEVPWNMMEPSKIYSNSRGPGRKGRKLSCPRGSPVRAAVR